MVPPVDSSSPVRSNGPFTTIVRAPPPGRFGMACASARRGAGFASGAVGIVRCRMRRARPRG
ncbi:hypothetical protein BOC42_01600 [Burkholderia pseudomallei]|nr:hypothetical protein BOC42_01600 [Burkholderia pseudomallei]ARL01869.1 hypothetical protein BOC44_08975 [Burkholderia pseudomallei]ARL37824.1 hypothetical protein BOC49_17555 [Burkholderia pseudomallei]ARM01973.1 hypothetical protein BOC59_19775 [Burkholderia pseudomallei]OSO86005.1 hypothetical protein BOC56_05485 [Burkholderia pseudomallei]